MDSTRKVISNILERYHHGEIDLLRVDGEIWQHIQSLQSDSKRVAILEEENKRLKAELKEYQIANKMYAEDVKKLEAELKDLRDKQDEFAIGFAKSLLNHDFQNETFEQLLSEYKEQNK